MEQEQEKKEIEVTLTKVIGYIIAAFLFVGVLALIWAAWRVLQVCATIVFVAAVFLLIKPDNLD